MPASFLSRKLPGLLTAACALAATLPGIAAAAEAAVLIPPPAQDAPAGVAQEKAVLAGGCFWGVQAVFQHVRASARPSPAMRADRRPPPTTTR